MDEVPAVFRQWVLASTVDSHIFRVPELEAIWNTSHRRLQSGSGHCPAAGHLHLVPLHILPGTLDNYALPHSTFLCVVRNTSNLATATGLCGDTRSDPVCTHISYLVPYDMQDVKSSRILSGFDSLVPPDCIVIRGGEPTRVPSRDLVVGDVVSLQTGVRVPADMRCITGEGFASLQIQVVGSDS